MASVTSTWLTVWLILAPGRPDCAGTLYSPRRASTCLAGDYGTSQRQSGPTSQERARQSEMWWRGEDTLTEFGIDNRRARELEAIFQRTLPMLKSAHAEVVRKEDVLWQLLADARTTNESAVVQAVEDLETSRRSLSRTFTMMQYHMYLRLTAAQRAKVHTYLNHHATEPAKARSTPR